MSLVKKVAPEIKATAVMEDGSINTNFSLKKYLNGKNAILFFYPCNFTFVCPSEIIAFDRKIVEFKKRNTKIIGVSTDSEYSHIAYRNMSIENGGIDKIRYPLISDITKNISKSYDVLHDNCTALRGSFLIDQNFIIRHALVNDLPLGRCINETLRIIDALLFYNKYGDVCPANWKPGKKTIKPTVHGIKKYLTDNINEL